MFKMIVSLSLAAIVLVAGSSARATTKDKGVYVSLGSTGMHLDLQDQAISDLGDAGVTLGTNGIGGELQAGYRFGDHVSLGLRLSGTELDTGIADVDGALGMFALQVTGHLRPGQSVQPYLTGGVGGAGLILDGGEFDGDEALEASLLNLGAGVDLRFARRWSLSFDYRASVIDFESGTIDMKGGRSVAFDGSGFAQELGFRWTFHI